MRTKRAFLEEPGRFEIHEVDIKPGKNQMLLKVSACGLCNWEQNHWKGILGGPHQTLGHEWCGTIVELGESVDNFRTGDFVTGLGGEFAGFSEYMIINADACFKVDSKVNKKYALGEPLKCIITVLKGAAPEAGDSGVIVGCGPMGLWCIQALAGNYLSSLIAIDVDDTKLELARKFGATHTINPKKQDVISAITDITDGHMADFVIEGTGNPRVLNGSVPYLKRGRGRLVIMSSHEEICKEFDFREAANRGVEIRIAHPAYSTNQLEDLRRAVDLLNKGIFKMDEIVTHEFRLDEIQKAFESLENKPSSYLKGIVVME
jgi:threonine dehydrogenase-like Zn-dependent dehydrogenase